MNLKGTFCNNRRAVIATVVPRKAHPKSVGMMGVSKSQPVGRSRSTKASNLTFACDLVNHVYDNN